MSKTFRRKTRLWDRHNYVDEWMKPDNILSFTPAQALAQNLYSKYVRKAAPLHLWSKDASDDILDVDKARARLTAMFHADRRLWGIPQGLRARRNRTFRAKQANALRTYLNGDILENDLVVTPFLHDAKDWL